MTQVNGFYIPLNTLLLIIFRAVSLYSLLTILIIYLSRTHFRIESAFCYREHIQDKLLVAFLDLARLAFRSGSILIQAVIKTPMTQTI